MADHFSILSEQLLHPNHLGQEELARFTNEALHGLDDGELFLEKLYSEQLAWDDGRLRQASQNSSSGFGLRGILDETVAYAHSSRLDMPSLKRAAETISLLKGNHAAHADVGEQPAHAPLYTEANPIGQVPQAEKIALLQSIDQYVRRKDNRVRQVSVSIYSEWQVVGILRSDGVWATDVRPLVRLNVSVVVEQDGRLERGSAGAGGRFGFDRYMQPHEWQKIADDALRQSLINLDAIAAPAGEYNVVLGPGWPGVLLHEAIGHGLEGDFNRKQTSAFHNKVGTRVAAKGVTIVDDGTLPDRRGSITIDDEGTPSGCTTLIEDGILKGFIHDRMNARLMGQKPTGNGRRESYACAPMPRMTNTYMLGGEQTPEEIIQGVKRGIYAPYFGGGQVDITSGKFVFSASEAYLIEDGRLTSPIKGATLIGNGPDVLTRITAIGNDARLDDGIGTCGKAGQSVPVGVGQPTLRIDGLTVGGTAA
ncbi:metalloprotease TldD [bacterium]|nr:metalloprotease TldD [bacterium]